MATIRQWHRINKIRSRVDLEHRGRPVYIDKQSLLEYVKFGIVRDADGKAWMTVWGAVKFFNVKRGTLRLWVLNGHVTVSNDVITTTYVYCPYSIQKHINAKLLAEAT